MRRAIISPLLICAVLTGCGEPNDIIVPEPEIIPTSGISLGGMSFFFPAGLEFEGDTETCPNRASECPLGDDSVHAVWRSGTLRFDYVLDHFGKAMTDDEWGEPITINGRPAFRKMLDDGGRRYLITNHYGGSESSAVAIWREEEEPIFWGTCHDDEDCDAVLQTLASVTMRAASQECALMFPPPPPDFVPPPDYCEDCSIIAPPPAPLPGPEQMQPAAPPPPPAPGPSGAEALCKEYVDEA
ncbi:hypothetical protein [Croceicoccus sp. YJ47]|uniref:hypothetical protein n=1 Tax=Croceicoccus sp. YJ47 TaxID=2798724 RepID=UPI0019227334|nr:hypothetical protein [Croceicoccus sp. YJ47]QQN74375.1 hypothetical protein JD971_00780 [Croceicoccus sp. YJ47]